MNPQHHTVLSPDDARARLRSIAERIAAACPHDAWLVGGVVRDALLDRPLEDIDIAVAGACEHAARAIAASLGGTPFPLSDRHGCWRIADSDRQIDVCTIRGKSIETDLQARDFTMNAMAVSCSHPETIIDPYGGIADLEAGLVRAVGMQAFDDDPLRLLRAARFAHVFQMKIEAATEQWVRDRTSQLTEPSGERIYAEFCALLDAPEQRRGMRLLDDLGVLAAVLPELDACRGIEQSRFHHLDVFEHTLAVLDNVEDIVGNTGFYLGEPVHTAQPFGAEGIRMLQLAALLHDSAKPSTRGTHPVTGGVTFVGHDNAGVRIVDAVCDRWATSNRIRDGVKHLVRTHLELGMLLHGPMDARARWRFLRSMDSYAAEAIVLSVADRLATAGVDDRRRWVRAHMECARAVWADHWTEHAEGIPRPFLDGREIAELAGVEPGPVVGQLVRALAEEQAVGAVTSSDEARAFIARSVPERA